MNIYLQVVVSELGFIAARIDVTNLHEKQRQSEFERLKNKFQTGYWIEYLHTEGQYRTFE